jgi:6-phosphofructokinase 1
MFLCVCRNEEASDTHTTEVISNVLKSEGKRLFDSRTAILGHTQQGGNPSPLDRIRASRLAVKCIQFIEDHAFPALNKAYEENLPRPVSTTTDAASSAVIGIVGSNVLFTPVRQLLNEADMKNRRGKNAWWMPWKGLVHLLAIQGKNFCRF